MKISVDFNTINQDTLSVQAFAIGTLNALIPQMTSSSFELISIGDMLTFPSARLANAAVKEESSLPNPDIVLDVDGNFFDDNFPTVTLLADADEEVFFKQPWWKFDKDRQSEYFWMVAAAKAIFVPSRRVSDALVVSMPAAFHELTRKKTHVVGHGPNPNPILPADVVTRRITKEVYGKEHSYFYAPSSGHASDNLERLFAAYDVFRARCKEPVRLLVGLPEYELKHRRAVRKARKRAKFSQDIVLLPEQSDHEYRKVFSSARAIVYPSLSTSFPLPVLDAWTAEIPVLYTDNDILQGAGALVQGTDEQSIAEGMVSLVTTPFLASGLVENGKRRLQAFSWEAVAERVAGVLREVGGSG